MKQQILESKVFKQHQELVYRPKLKNIVPKLLSMVEQLLVGTGSVNLDAYAILEKYYLEGYIHSLDLAFDDIEGVEEYLLNEIKWKDQTKMIAELQEQFQVNILTKEVIEQLITKF